MADGSDSDAPPNPQSLESSLMALMNALVESSSTNQNEGESQEQEVDEQQNESDGVSEDTITTFLEFTGTSDRDRARLYLAGSDNLEQAVNLFLSGVSPEHLAPPPSRRRRVVHTTDASAANALPQLLREVLASQMQGSENPNGDHVPRLAALLAGLEGSNDPFFSELLASGAPGILSGRGLGQVNRVSRSQSDLDSGSILTMDNIRVDSNDNSMDEEYYAAAKVAELRGGAWDRSRMIGDAIIHSAKQAENYLMADLADVVSDALPIAMASGDDPNAIRILQLMETIIRIMGDGHGPAALHCSGWYVTSQRSTKKYRRAPKVELFMNHIVPVSDVDALKRLWNDGFDPSWKDPETGMDMLTYALKKGCSVEFIEYLVDPIRGCRAVVNTEPEQVRLFGSPLFIAGTATCITPQHVARDAGDDTMEHSSGADPSDDSSLPLPPSSTSSSYVMGLESYREDWSLNVVQLLIDAGAAFGELKHGELDQFTPKARKFVKEELEADGALPNGRMRGKIFAGKTGEIKIEDVELWWQNSSPKVFASLLQSIASSRLESTTHRAMEVLAIFIKRWRGYPHYDTIRILEAGAGAASAAFMQLLQSVFTSENDDLTALFVAVRIVNAILEVSTPPPGTTERLVGRSEEDISSTCIEPEIAALEDDLADFHAQLCLGFCRFGVTHRLGKLASNISADEQIEIREPKLERSKLARGGANRLATSNAIAQRTTAALAKESAIAVAKIKNVIVDVLGLGEDTMHGVSPMLMEVCRGLHDGSEEALQKLVFLLRRGTGVHGSGGVDGSDEIYFPSDDGITPFEFEQSGLAAALLKFLQVSTVAGGKQIVSNERLGRLLAAMPPPVALPEHSTMGALDAIGAGYEDAEEDEDGDDASELAQRSSTLEGVREHNESQTLEESEESSGKHTGGENKVGSPRVGALNASTAREALGSGFTTVTRAGEVAGDLWDTSSSVNSRGSPMSRGSRSPSNSMPLGIATNAPNSVIESGTVHALRALSFQFGSNHRRGSGISGATHGRRRSSLFGGEGGSSGHGGRSNSLTMESIDLMDVVGQKNSGTESKSTSLSALHRLVGKLQSVISIHAPHSFPVLSHEAPSSGGIRALVNPIKLKLRRDPADQNSMCHNQASELNVQVLPLTPLRELELEVLRAVLIVNPKYQRYCRKLVGHKVRHRPAPTKFGADSEPDISQSHRYTVSLVKAYDPEFGVHKLEHLSVIGGEYEWAVIAVKEYQILERVFGDETQDTDSEAEFDDAISGPDDDCINNNNKIGTRPPSDSLVPPEEDKLVPGAAVAVWWEGYGGSGLGWRSGTIVARNSSSASGDDEPTFDIQYNDDAFMEDDVIRRGDVVRLTDDVDAIKRLAVGNADFVSEMANHAGKTAVVTNIRGTRVSTNGLGGFTYNILALRKLKGEEKKAALSASGGSPRLITSLDIESSQRRLSQGDEVILSSTCEDLHGLANGERGTILADDRSRRPFQVRLPDGKTHWYTETDLVLAPKETDNTSDTPDANSPTKVSATLERGVASNRVCLKDSLSAIDSDHIFAVVLEPNRKPSTGRSVLSLDTELVRHDTSTAVQQTSSKPKPNSTPGVFELNDRIEGRYGGRSRWYKGRISRVNIDGTYDLAYDDGDTERGVNPIHVARVGHTQQNIESFDFRKLFSNSVGRALFDALRREDHVLNTEYNFVTRGFEHQPSFYQMFSETLEQTGFGVFAQFQTREQAEVLHERIMRIAVGTNTSRFSQSQAVLLPKVIIMDKTARMPQSVEREISAAFEKMVARIALQRSLPPPPGQRAQVEIFGATQYLQSHRKEMKHSIEIQTETVRLDGPAEGTDSDSDDDVLHGESQLSHARWLSATVIQLRHDRAGRKRFTIVLDDGTLMFGIPGRFLRMTQRTSRKFPFKPAVSDHDAVTSPEATSSNRPGTAPTEAGSSRSLMELDLPPEPVELSRQFSAFGSRTAYKHIQVGSPSREEESNVEQMSAMPPSAICTVDGMVVKQPTISTTPKRGNSPWKSPSFGGRPYSAPEFSSMNSESLVGQEPPTFEVDFTVVSLNDKDENSESDASDDDVGSELNKVRERKGVAITSGDGSDMSMFQSLYQLFHSGKALPESQSRTLATWSNEYRLQWQVTCMFPDDEQSFCEPSNYELENVVLDQIDDFCELNYTKQPHHEWVVHKSLLPWKSPKELIAATKQVPSLTRMEFFEKLRPALTNADEWARSQGLEALSQIDADEAQREVKRISWAEIATAYANLCQAPLSLESPLPTSRRGGIESNASSPSRERWSPARSPVRSRSGLRSPRRIPTHTFLHERSVDVSSLLDICNVPASHQSARDALALLKVLYDELVARYLEGGEDNDDDSGVSNILGSTFAKSLPWRNTVVSNQLREQLSDPLSIATRCFPRWVEVLPRMLSFLFKTKDREVHLRCTSLGISRAVAWLQDEVTGYKAKKRQLAQVTLEMSAMFQGVPDIAKYERLQEISDRLEDELRAIEQEHCIGHLHQDLVKVSRDDVLHDAEQLMEQHRRERSELVIQFVDESGTGDGVTVDFYSSVAAKLQERVVNAVTPMWVDGTDPQNLYNGKVTPIGTKQVEQQDTNSNATSNEERKQDEHIAQHFGLYPAPLAPIVDSYYHGEESDQFTEKAKEMALRRNEQILNRFRFLGRLMAKAFLDGMHVPLPLCQEFFKLVKYRNRLSLSSVAIVEGDEIDASEEVVAPASGNGTGVNESALISAGGLYSALFGLWRRGLKQDIAALKERLDAAEVRFIDPTQLPFAEDCGYLTSDYQQGDKVDEHKDGEEYSANVVEQQNGSDTLQVPGVEADLESLAKYAQRASEYGLSQSEIDSNLAKVGHSKMTRWKAMKNSQSIRTKIALNKAAKERSESLKRNVAIRAAELCPGGFDKLVDLDNVGEFLSLLSNRWLEHGVLRQAEAFRLGLMDVLGKQGSSALLADFSPSELRNLLCGKQQVQWDENDELLGCLRPMGKYTSSSPPIRMLVQALKEMTMPERSQFLSFTTSQPRVPLSGLPLIKVYPPSLTNVAGFTLATFVPSRISNSRAAGHVGGNTDSPCDNNGVPLFPGDTVMLAEDYTQWEDAIHGPMQPGITAVAEKVEGRVLVNGWWYNPRAIRKVTDGSEASQQGNAKQDMLEEAGDVVNKSVTEALVPGAWVRTSSAVAKIQSYNPNTREILFDIGTSVSQRRAFKPGQAVHVVHGSTPENGTEVSSIPRLSISHLTEQPDVIQMPPYLRPKATTCVKTLYLPEGYENHRHLLTVFRGAFEDAKLGGIQDG